MYRLKNNGDIGSEFEDSQSGAAIRSVSLNTVLNGKRNVIIKSNSEGSEYRIFTKATDLKNVYRIHIAYHYGVQKLPEILKSKGFRIRIWKEGTDVSKGEIGMIYAWR